jgi:hypothetical protein
MRRGRLRRINARLPEELSTRVDALRDVLSREGDKPLSQSALLRRLTERGIEVVERRCAAERAEAAETGIGDA